MIERMAGPQGSPLPWGSFSFDILLIRVILSDFNHPLFSYTVPWSANCLEGSKCWKIETKTIVDQTPSNHFFSCF